MVALALLPMSLRRSTGIQSDTKGVLPDLEVCWLLLLEQEVTKLLIFHNPKKAKPA